MKYLGKITDQKDLTTKEYVDNSINAKVSINTDIPSMDGTGAAGVSDRLARADHVHPTDTSRANKNLIADGFSTSHPYEVGEYCIQDDLLYKCTTTHTGAWDATHFEVENITNGLSEVEESIPRLEKDLWDTQIDISTLYNIKAPIIVEQAEGAIVSFNDGAKNYPMDSAIVSLEPVQSFNGYDTPWPGGGGKNLIPLTLETIKTNNTSGTWNGNVYTSGNSTATVQTDEGGNVTGISINTSNSALTLVLWLHPMFDGTAIMNGCPSGGSTSTYYLQYLNYVDGAINETGSGTSAFSAYDLESYPDAKVLIVVKSGTYSNLVFKPMIRLSTVSDDAYAPYSNICPITGWTGANVTRTGKNLADPTNLKHGFINASGEVVLNSTNRVVLDEFVSVKDISEIVCSNGGGLQFIIFGYNDDKSPLYDTSWKNSGVSVNVSAFSWVKLTFRDSNNADITTADVTELMLEYGSTATAYESYQGTTYSVTWQTEAGTVYGGTLDVVSGVLNVTHSIIDLGNVNWNKDSNRAGVFYGAVAGRKNTSYVLACSEYTVRNIDVITDVDMYVSGKFSYGGDYIFVRDTRFASNTAAEYKAGAAGIKAVYELAAPIEYTLTPQEVTTLLGENHVWADTGNINIVYPADTKKYIDNKIVQIVTSMLNS